MDVGDTQLIDDSPQGSPSRSSMSGESTGSDGPLHDEPTQLLYTQLLDQYQGRMEGAHKTQHLDMETQLLDDHNFDDFRKNEGIIIPSEDEASKETQLIHGGEVHSGSSSGKDGEVDSALSPLSAAFHQKTHHWLSEFTHRDRSIQGAAGRTPQATFPYRDRYLGETQILSDDENGEAHDELAKEQRNFPNSRAGVGGCPDLHNRDGDGPPFLGDFDPNRRDYAGQRMVGSWHEVVEQSDGCNEVHRGWEDAVGGLQLVDSDASTEDEVENQRNSVFNTDISYPGEGQLLQNVNSRLSTHVSSNFCNQDLNKSPEPENAMDEWEDGNRVDLGLGKIDESGSNVGLFNRVEQVDLGRPSQSAPTGVRTNEGLNETMARPTPSTSRTAGSIRTASLRASALQASSCCSSERYRRCTPQGSKSEEVEKVEREETIEMASDVPQKAGGSSGDTTSMSRPSIDGQGPSSTASFVSVLPSRNRVTDSPRMENKVLGVGKTLDYSDVKAKEDSKIDRRTPEEGASVLGLESTSAENRSRARKLFLGNGNERDKDAGSSEEEDVEAQSRPSLERVDVGKKIEAESLPPRENRTSPGEKSLERRSSFGSGLFSTGSEMSYLNLHSPGEDSQARALTMVDKLVWLNAIGLPQELQLEEEKAPARGPLNAKNVLQSRVQVAEAKAAMDDPFGVFDWVDSQNDEAGIFYGGGSSKAIAGKGISKQVNAAGQPKQSGLGIKKSAVLDVVGSKTKKIEKLPEKEKGVTSTPNINKQKELVSKNLSVVMENRREPQEGRLGSRSGATNNRQEPARIEQALSLEESHQDWVGNVIDRRPGLVDKGLTKLGSVDNTLTAEKVQLVSTAKGPHQQRSKTPAKQARFDRLSNDTGLEHGEEAAKAPNNPSKMIDVQKGKGDRTSEKQAGEHERLHKDRRPSGQSRSNFGPKVFGDSRGTNAVEAPESIDHQHLQETRSLDKEMDAGGCKYNVGDSNLSPQTTRNNRFHRIEGKAEREQTTLDKVGCPISVQGDANGKLESYVRVGRKGRSSEVSPDKSSTRTKVLDGASDPTSLAEGLQQQNYTDTVEEGGRSQGVGKYPRSSKHTLDGNKVQLVVNYNGLRRSGHLDGSSLAEQSDHMDVLTMSPMEDAHIGPDTNIATEKSTEFLKTNPITINGEGVVREDRNEDVAISSEILSSRNDLEDERTPKIEEENMYNVPKKGQMATRRGRSQTRYSAKVLENTAPEGGSSNLIRPEKGRGRRVTWAGPLEQVPRQSRGLRSRRRLRVQNEGRGEDVAESTADSSGQEEEAVDMKEATRSENGTRKRTSEAFDMMVSRDNDLDKIKRRFHMSDAAVARLLGTDEEEDAEPDQARAVKVRSLSHIQPEADGNEAAASPSFKRFGKGLRSARNRSEDGGRRLRPFTSTDQGKLDEDDVVLSFDENVPDGNVDGTTAMETHPSDNEVVSGRRRMRSIADVSFPNFPQTTPGRPPLARGLRRRRGRHFVKAPPETRADLTDDDLTDVPPCAPPSVSPLIGRLRGKGGPRSVRKRKERESEPVPATSEVSLSPNSSREMSPTNFKRRKWTGTACVLLSHGLNEDTMKQQRKILARLGGRVATSSSECSHFVADKFVRTGNMLEAMASGKPVVNIQWLETCSEANRFVDEEEFILQDTQKEEEMGFSMITTLSAARQRPLLQGIRVFMTPGTSPGPDSLARIVKSAGGQVVDGYFGPAADGEQESDFCVVISSEEELDDCIPLLDQGAKVYTPELLLSGVTNYHLDFSNDQLFKNFTTRRRRGSSSRRSMV